MKKRALITGITGQDGSYLAEFLLEKGYHVLGSTRWGSKPTRERSQYIPPDVDLVSGDLLDVGSLQRTLSEYKIDEIYNLGALSFVPASFTAPRATALTNALGLVNLLESTKAKIYQAGSSEMFGNAKAPLQDESTPFNPCSPYACSKVYAHHMVKTYREAYGLFAVNGILFNHESPRRGMHFVTRKITSTVAKIKLGVCKKLQLGNLDARRDWGFAGDYVKAMWLMLQQEKPDDYVIATGRSASVREFAKLAFECVGLNYEDYVECDASLIRPTEVNYLLGDASKAKKVLGWEPTVNLESLVDMMVKSDLALFSR